MFEFTATNGTTVLTGSVGKETPATFTNVPPGTYTIVEVPNSRYTLDGIVKVPLELTKGNSQTLTITNRQKVVPPPTGTLVISKQVKNNGIVISNPTVFTVNVKKAGEIIASGKFTQDLPFVVDNLVLNTYTIEEVAINGYTGSINKPSVILTPINLVENILVTNNVISTGSILITKVINSGGVPIADNKLFSITATNGTTTRTGFVSQNSPLLFSNLPLGTYTITEGIAANYTLGSITPNTVTLTTLNTNQSVAIVNNLIPLGIINITKYVTDSLGAAVVDNTNFGISLVGPATRAGSVSQNSSLSFENLPLGIYTIAELSNSLYTLTSISPSTTVTLTTASLTADVNITNAQIEVSTPGSITISKEVLENSISVPDSSAFEVSINNGITSRTGFVTKGVDLVFSNLELGTYTVSEIVLKGYQ
ncbi:MAG: hypothetical protein ACOH2V_00195 [Candidatus Saccharimonadaceae bacterium]